ncbi:MAG: hypothetical protein AB1444_07070 [Spirochaetota bacterium]
MKKYLSYLLSTSLFIGISILAYFKIFYSNKIWINSFTNYDVIIVVLYLLWMIYEVKVSHNDVKQEIVVSDYGTREFYGFSHALTILSALWFNSIWQRPGIYHIIGLIIFLFGILYRI